MLERNTDVNLCEENGYSPLHVPLKNGYCNIAPNLLCRDAYVKVIGKDGYSPLHLACQHEQDQVVQILIDKHSNVNLL